MQKTYTVDLKRDAMGLPLVCGKPIAQVARGVRISRTTVNQVYGHGTASCTEDGKTHWMEAALDGERSFDCCMF